MYKIEPYMRYPEEYYAISRVDGKNIVEGFKFIITPKFDVHKLVQYHIENCKGAAAKAIAWRLKDADIKQQDDLANTH